LLVKSSFLRLRRDLVRDRWLYLFMLIPLAYFIIFKYGPMYGIIIAFKDFKIGKGIIGSDWIGFQQFRLLFNSPDFFIVLRNTLLLNIYGLVFGFPVPIIIALLLNEIRNRLYKRINQSVLYIPHFISWVILAGIFIQMLSPSTGIINNIIKALGGQPVYFMANNFWWVVVYVVSGIWQGAGWGTIIYLAAISGIDPDLYEAARMDGANRLAQMWHITLPCIKATIAILLILRMGSMLGSDFEKVYTLQNSAVYDVSEIGRAHV
jgi:putative aldouronate transport system permease protein